MLGRVRNKKRKKRKESVGIFLGVKFWEQVVLAVFCWKKSSFFSCGFNFANSGANTRIKFKSIKLWITDLIGTCILLLSLRALVLMLGGIVVSE